MANMHMYDLPKFAKQRWCEKNDELPGGLNRDEQLMLIAVSKCRDGRGKQVRHRSPSARPVGRFSARATWVLDLVHAFWT